MTPQGQPGGDAAYLITPAFIVLALLRGARTQNLRIERLWITPVIILGMTGLMFSQQRPPTTVMIFLDGLALAIGAALGWWRGRFTRITIDPATHSLTSRASPLGMLLLAGIFALRLGLRSYVFKNAGALHLSAAAAGDAFVMVAVGLVCAQRLEIALRASRLLTSAPEAPDPQAS